MQVHRLTNTRVITSTAKNNEQSIFTGSSFNRKQDKAFKEKESQIRPPLCWDEWETNKNLHLWQDSIDERPDTFEGVQDGGKLLSKKRNERRTNTLSNRSKDKLRNKIESLFRCSDGFTLATLTFVDTVSDQQGVKVLNKFLTVVRKRNPNLQYIWVAERQENGNIHFHIITNKYLKVQYYNALWVLQQYNAGIESPGLSRTDMDTALQGGKLQQLLNPFDIKEVKTIEGLAIYLTMYVTKNDASFECATWYCSRAVSALFTGVLVGESVVKDAGNKAVNWSVNKKTGEVYEAKIYVMEYATIISILNKKFFKKNFSVMDMVNKKILQGMKACNVPTVQFFEYDNLYNNPTARSKKIIINEIFNLKRSAN